MIIWSDNISCKGITILARVLKSGREDYLYHHSLSSSKESDIMCFIDKGIKKKNKKKPFSQYWSHDLKNSEINFLIMT